MTTPPDRRFPPGEGGTFAAAVMTVGCFIVVAAVVFAVLRAVVAGLR